MRRPLVIGLILALAASAAWAQQIYRWVDDKGRVHVTDTPPPPSARGVQKSTAPAGNTVESAAAPFPLAQAIKDFPVTLYTSPLCKEPCAQARGALNRRAVPFKEVQVWDEPDFRTGKIDILVGTQMIAKGLHFPNVTLVGIIHADLGLHIPDFRAGERTFQLLTQVAGRAGRGDVEGEVWVQAFTPFHPSIQYARKHDFLGFYEQEIEFREQLRYPPFSRIALLTFRGRNEEKVEFTANHFRKELDALVKDFPDLTISGPAPAPLAKAEKNYRFQIMLRVGQMSRLSKRLNDHLQKTQLPDDVALSVDIDPVNLQ